MTLNTDSASSEWQLLVACGAPQADAPRIRERVRAGVDWAALLTLAEGHGMVPLLAKRLGDAAEAEIPAEARRILHDQRRSQAFFALAMDAELFRVCGRLEAAGLEAAVVKGPALAVQAFGDPGLRQYSDLDIVLRHRDVLRAAAVMREAGFDAKVSLEAAAAGRIPGQFLFTRAETRIVVELHTERTLRYFPRALALDGVLARRVRVKFDGHEAAAVSPADSLVMICVHGSKHLWQRLMWIADVAALVARQQSLGALDWPRALATARETGAGRMLRLGLRLAMDEFDTRIPKDIAAAVRGDAAGRLAASVMSRLPNGENGRITVAERAAFRMRMCGGPLRSPAYLLRLAFAPTEDDWGEATAGWGSRWLEAVRRPARLARKYGGARQGAPSAAGAPEENKKARA